MDIDIDQGDYMVNTQCVYMFQIITDRVDAGTNIQITIPYQLQMIATSGSTIGVCKEAAYISSTNTMQNNTLSNCMYNEYIGYSAITLTVGKAYTGLTAYYLFIGMIRNPPSVQYPDSFGITLSNGYPSGTFNQGLILNYIPNLIYSATLTHLYSQAGTTDTYTFKFKITDNVLQRGYLQITFPSQWSSAPQNIQSITAINVYGTSKTGFGVATPITDVVTYTGLFDLAQLTADSTKYITVTLTGITNPSSISTTDSFTITTLDDAMQAIDQVSTGLTISITQPGVITVNSYIVGSQTVDAYTFLQFTVTPTVKYSNGGYIDVIGDQNYVSTSSTVTCSGSLGMSGSTTCTRVNAYTIRITKNPSSGLLVTVFQMTFSVQNFRNALGVITQPAFTIQFRNSDGTLVAQTTTAASYTTTAGALTVSSAVRSTSVLTVGLTGAQYTLTFTTQTRLPTAGRLVFTFPDEQVSYYASTTCQDGSGKTLICTLAQGSGTFTVTIAATQYCSSECAAGSSFTLVLINAKNPSYINSPLTQSVQIQTQNFLNNTFATLDQVTSGVYFTNSLVPGTLTNLALARSGSSLTGGIPIYTFTFKTATVLPSGAVVIITFPTATGYLQTSTSVTCSISSTSKTCTTTGSTSDSTILQTVTISSACTTTTCAAPYSYSIAVTNFYNPFSTLDNTNVAFTIQTQVSSSNGLVDTATFNAAKLALSPNALTVALTAPSTPIVVGQTTSYTLTVTNPVNKIPSTTNQGSLVITFPDETNVLSTTCSAQTSSTSLTCAADTTTQKVTVTSSTDLPAGTTITIQMVNNIQNPPTGATSSPFVFYTYYGTAQIDTSTSLTVKPDTFNDILNPLSNRDVVTVNSAIKLTLSFQTTNPIPANAQIKFYIPVDQAVIDTTQTFGAVDKSGSGSVTTITTLSGPVSNYNTFTLKEWCSDDNGGTQCPTTFTSKIQISGFKNPANARFPTNSIKIEIYTSAGDKIDAVSQNFFTIPQCNYGALQSVTISRTVDTVGQSTAYTFKFQTNTNGDLGTQGYVNIQFPVAFLFDKTSPTPTCTVKDATSSTAAISTTCTATKVADPNNMGNYISMLVGNLQCSTINCGGGATFEFTVTGYMNPFSTKPRDGQIISTSTSTGSGSTAEIKNVLDQIIGTDISKTQLPDFTAGALTSNSIVRTVLNVDANTIIQFSITLATRLEKNGYIYVSVPSTQFVPSGENYQYQMSTGSSTYGTAQTLTVSSQTSTETVFIIKESCSGTGYYCSENTSILFQIPKGFANVGYVTTPTNFFTIRTYTRDDTYIVDEVTGKQATPAVIPAVSTVSKVTITQNYAAFSGVTVDIALKFGADIKPGIYLLLTFSTEFIRMDAGAITCSIIDSTSTETTKTCTTTQTSNVVNTVNIPSLCSTTCDGTSTYTIRLKNVVNRLYVDAFSGTMLVETRVSSTSLVSTVTYQLSSVTTLLPGPLTNTAVTRAKSTQGATNDFTLTWTTPGYLTTGSLIEIRFPMNQIIFASGSAYTFKNGNTALTFTTSSGSPTSTYNIFEGSQWLCTSTTSTSCSSGLTFTLTVSNSKNPFIQSTNYDDFIIIHKRSDGKQIFQSPSPLVATPDLAFGVIDKITITHQNQPYVSTSTQYLFAFTVEDDIPTGGKIRITFPPNRVLQLTTSNLTCTVGTTAYPCTVTYTQTTGTQVIITGVCSTAACTGPSSYSVLLSGGLLNPSSVPLTQTGNFLIETVSSSNYIVSQGKMPNANITNILPQPITATVVRSSQYMGAVNDYRVKFDTVNAIPSGGYLRIVFPTDQVFVPTNGPTCKVDYTLTSLNCQIVYKPTGYIYVDIASPCSSGCTAGYTIQIVLGSLQNPTSFLANSVTSSFGVYTMNSNKEYIDGQYTNLKATPSLIGKTAIIKAVELGDNVVARSNYISFLIVPGSDFTKDAIFDFYFPDQFALYNNINTCYVVIGSNVGMTCTYTTYTSGYIYKVSLSNPCPYGCAETGIYLFQIPIKNRGDNYYPAGQFMIIERYTDIDVGQGTMLNSLTFNTDFISDFYVYNAGRDTIEQDSKLYISFRPKNWLPTATNKGRIRVVLPSEILSYSSHCQAQIDLSGSLISCSISGQTAILTHNSSNIVSANVTIEIPQIINPSTTRPTSPILVYTEVDSLKTGTYYQIDTNTINITYKVNTCTPLYDVQITRLPMNDQLGYQTGQPTQLIFYLQLRHALESTSSIIVQMPAAAQVQISSTTSSATCYSTDYLGAVQNLLLCELITSNRTVIVRNYCQVAACSAKSRVYFKMFDDFILNYNYVVSPLNSTRDSMLVRTTTKEGYYYIDESSTNVFITPALVPTFLILPSPEIIRTNNVINRRVQWVTSFKTNKNPVPQGGYVQISIPQNVLLTIKNSSIDVLNYDNSVLYPNYTYTLYPDGKSVQLINLTKFCNTTKGCPVGSAYSIMIDWIKNPISQLGYLNSPITIETFTKEGYAAELGTTPAVYQLFSELIPVNLQNLFVRIINPVSSVITDYIFTFSADAEFNTTNILIITFPAELTAFPNVTTSRMLASTKKCEAPFTPYANLTCSQNGNNSILIQGLFLDGYQQYSIRINNVQNPQVAGTTSGFNLEVQNNNNLTIASRSTNTRITILDQIKDQTTCNKVCGSCAGTTSTCTTCNNPSKYPLFRNYACVDSCGEGYFFDETNLQCAQCHHGCSECFGPGSNKCLKCASNYYLEDGICVPYCTKGMIENSTLGQCVQSNSTLCSANCQTCSFSNNYCLSCKPNSLYPYLDTASGKCIPYDSSQCNNTYSTRFYIDTTEKKCKTCNELCKTCDRANNICTSCWSFQTNNKINELYETCVDVCGLGTWYNKDYNMCSYCNQVCLTCTGYESDQCLVCNKTPEARQLYLYDNECVLQCPKRYYINEISNECIEGQAQILSFSFLFMFASVFCGILVVVISIYRTKNKHKLIDVIFAVMSCVEALNRLFLLGNMWFKSNVFALAVCFMNLIATCAIAVFFNFLFMSPIYAHSPHFRTLYKKFRLAYNTVTCISYFAGVNLMRLLCANFLGLESLQSDLHNWKFFLVPLNTMSNFTVIFTVCQLAIDVFILMTLTISDDAFVLAILGLFINVTMITFQIFKHLNVKAFLARTT